MHEQFLLAALEQAQLGLGSCAPNPSVGAVAVQNETIIARAFHHGAGTPHAEQLLLAQLPPKMRGVSVYISLEPCNHWGKTPPCTDALIDYGIEAVFFAYKDPNPIVASNDSVAQLLAHGIKVQHRPLPLITDFYKSYTHWVHTKKPWVTVKMAQSFDGKIGALTGQRLVLSNQLCADFTHEQRALSDVILSSARTILCDNPSLNVRRKGAVQAKPVAILDTNLSLTHKECVFSTASHCFIYHNEALAPRAHQNSALASYSHHPMPMINDRLDLNAVLTHLGAQGFHRVFVEAGGAVFSSLHKEQRVNQTYIYLVPESLDEGAVFAYQQSRIFERKHKVSWRVMDDNMIACLDWEED